MKKNLLAAIAFFCGTLSLSAQIPTNGLISKWSFDSRITSEFTKDEQGSYPLTNNGVQTGAPRTNLDTATATFGIGTSMTVNNSAFRPTSFSIATWFKINTPTQYHTLASVRISNSSAPYNSYNLNIGTSTGSKLTFFFTTTLGNDVQVQNPVITNNSVWTHAAITCDYNATEDSTSIKMYENSVMVAQKKVKSYITYSASNNPLVLGSVTGAPNGNTLLGNLDNAMFYNRPLTALEVSSIYIGNTIPTTGLISFWKFNQARIEHDSQNSFHLTNNNNGAPTTGITNIDSTAVSFNTTNSMQVNDSVFRLKSFSFATWFKIIGSSAYQTLANVRIQNSAAPYNSYNLNIGSSTGNRLTFFFTTANANDIQVQSSSTTGSAWTHAVITCDYNFVEDSTAVKMYENNIVVAQTKVEGFIIYSPSNNPLVLGSVAGAPNGNSLSGKLDEFLYYNRVLLPTEVATIYNGTSTGLNSFIKNQISEIVLYPNPTSSILNIEVKEQTQITIVNVLGEVVKTETINGLSTIDVSALNAGIYFVQDLKSGKAIKFIKE